MLTKKYSFRSFILFLLCFFLAWITRVWILDRFIPTASALTRQIIYELLRYAIWVMPATLFILLARHENPLKVCKITTRPSVRGSLFGLGLGLLIVVLMILPQVLHSGLAALIPSQTNTFVYWLWLVSVPIAEEYLFRGFVLTELQLAFGFWQANLIQAVLFGCVHIPGWLYFQGAHLSLLPLFLSVSFSGFVWGYIRHQSNSLFPSFVLHVVNNFLA